MRTDSETKMEKAVKIANNLYDIRDATKRFYGKEYEESINPYKLVIRATMEEHNISATEALIKISESLAYKEAGSAIMLIISACTEVILES